MASRFRSLQLTVRVSSYYGSYKNSTHLTTQATNTWKLKTVALPIGISGPFRVEFITCFACRIAIDEVKFNHMSCDSGD